MATKIGRRIVCKPDGQEAHMRIFHISVLLHGLWRAIADGSGGLVNGHVNALELTVTSATTSCGT